MITELTFYTTEGCHLCEEARVFLQQLLQHYPVHFQVEVIDIVSADNLIQQYGTRIPVVKNNASMAELGWPFDYERLAQFAGISRGK